MQLRYATNLSAEEYVRQEGWKDAKLDTCPLHLQEECGFRKNGTYKRKFPDGAKIARWYCSGGNQTFSLLPDCLSSRLSGPLIEVEEVVDEVEKFTDPGSCSRKPSTGHITSWCSSLDQTSLVSRQGFTDYVYRTYSVPFCRL